MKDLTQPPEPGDKARFINVSEIAQRLETALQELFAENEDAAVEWGFDGSERVLKSIRRWRAEGRLRVYRAAGLGSIDDDGIEAGLLLWADFAAIAREEFNVDLGSPAAEMGPATCAALQPQPNATDDPVLTTDEVCEAFAGIGRWDSVGWRRALTKDRPDWLMHCRADQGKRGNGGRQATWFPLEVAKALVQGAGRQQQVEPKELDRAFRARATLRPLNDRWQQVRNDNPAWGD